MMATYIDQVKVGSTTKDIHDSGARANEGTLANLTTTEKTNLVGAINEVNENVGDLNASLANKANVDGSYSNMTVGSADQLLSTKGVTDKVPYLFRRSGGNGADRARDTIVGGTIAWNQLANKNDYAATETLENVTFTNNADGSITATSSGAATGTAVHEMGVISNNLLITGHKYAILTGFATAGSATTYEYMVLGAEGNYNWNIYNDTIVAITSVTNAIKPSRFVVRNGATVTNLTLKPRIIDLTKALTPAIADYIYSLETATAGAGVAKLKEWGLFIKDYYEYDAGSLQSVQVASKVARGFNQWDEEWELGGIDNTTGENTTGTSTYRSKNYIPIVNGLDYYLYIGGSYTIGLRFYDAGKNYISSSAATESMELRYYNQIPSKTHYIRFVNTSANVYKNDICISISSDRNGEYEPYTEHVYPLDDSLTLRGIPKLDAANNLYYDGDTYESDGTVTRKYGIVDLGTLTWAISGNFFRTVSLSGIVTGKSYSGLFCSIYETKAGVGQPTSDKMISQNSSSGLSTDAILVSDSSYDNVESFTSAMSGVYLVYELATPTTEQADPYQETQIVDPYGTEEYVDAGVIAQTRDVAIPVGHETFYPENANKKLAGLPWDFSTLIASTEKGFTATKAYAVNEFLIVDNQLYKVTASIANGATITPNTNVTATTLGAQITALLNA